MQANHNPQIQAGWELFLNLVVDTESADDLAALCDFLLTPEECESLGLRVSLIRELLDARLTQREISKELGVSIAKITRGSNALKRITPKLRERLLCVLCDSSEKK